MRRVAGIRILCSDWYRSWPVDTSPELGEEREGCKVGGCEVGGCEVGGCECEVGGCKRRGCKVGGCVRWEDVKGEGVRWEDV